MKLLSIHFAGQSILSWGLQVILIAVTWLVYDHQIQNNLVTILTVMVLMGFTYMSLAKDTKNSSK
ncbi:hypothetical protein LROSL1_0344 [Furfurilactobacillus rossiae]|uniref:hypothetical protein n=1 Tax=Furfurilactobacillus rossiae TaxID=231049 RepID=UPI0015BC51FF|nr:hypothetical protein [Furfurilactobacillus rossiae]MCF6166175.1 hypothetical protein [Furfurilactobacillus rossiae]QLE63164.1 hypothetical protein LROSL1_0344 [Furfurilactobacillus rossiae]